MLLVFSVSNLNSKNKWHVNEMLNRAAKTKKIEHHFEFDFKMRDYYDVCFYPSMLDLNSQKYHSNILTP